MKEKAVYKMKNKKILYLILSKKWFNMILSGYKKEEYRENKTYWVKRLTYSTFNLFKEFDVIIFQNGYKKKSPTMIVECKYISVGYGQEKWGAEKNKKYFVIKLGKILKTKNLKKELI